jgi:hypothetical protein
MPSPSIASQDARRPSLPATRGSRPPGVAALLLLACVACDIDDRDVESGTLTLSSRRELASADAGSLALADAGPALGDAGTPLPSEPVEPPQPDAARPIRALGETSATPLVGGPSGKEELARCVQGILVGLDYRFNDSTAAAFSDRLIIVAPVCAVPSVSAGTVALDEPAVVAWSVIGGDGTDVVRPVPTRQLRCPEGYAIVGLTGSMDEVLASPQTFAVRELEIQCAPLLVSAERVDIARGVVARVAAERFSSLPGSIAIEVECESGTTAATGATVRWGSWLDGVGLQCSRLVWPFADGHGCVLDDECQSGVCGSWARCEP